MKGSKFLSLLMIVYGSKLSSCLVQPNRIFTGGVYDRLKTKANVFHFL
ncbi:MAG TPA: hypothetical protein VGC65_09625 [Bacteroidia bacterium]